MKVIDFEAKRPKIDKKEELLELFENVKSRIEDGSITSFVCVGDSQEAEKMTVYIGCENPMVSIGMFEIGKQFVMNGDFDEI